MIITIDGPAGSGKSTVAKRLAQKLGFEFFDTGAMYRAVTWYVLENKADINKKEEIIQLLNSFSFKIIKEKDEVKRYFVNENDVTSAIRSYEITQKVSEVSTKSYVREKVVELQRVFSRGKNAIFEGRDMGTVVFPYADLKFFLTAKAEIRAKRRFSEELLDKTPQSAEEQAYSKILKDIKRRDEIDSTREISPLKQAEDAFLIDTSKLSLEEVVSKLLKKTKKYLKRAAYPRPFFLKMKFFYGSVVFFSWLFFKLFHRLKVYGLKNLIKGPAIIASNHTSFYDPPLIAASSLEEIHFLARETLFKKPILGRVIKKLNTHPLSRSASDITTFKVIIKILKEGKKVILFPEGERSFEGKLKEIKRGVSFLAYLSKCMIIPVYIHGAYNAWKRTQKWPKLFGKITVVFGSPIYPYEFQDLKKDEYMKAVNSKITAALQALQKWCDEGCQGDLR